MTEENLYAALAASIGAGTSPIIPKIFAYFANKKEARLLLTASPPAPRNNCPPKQVIPLPR